MTVMSMTGFARVDGSTSAAKWHWEIRSVNGRGLDLRFRMPPGGDRLEQAARERVASRLNRGNVSLTLTSQRTEAPHRIRVNREALNQLLEIAQEVRAEIDAPSPTVEGMLALRGVLESTEPEESEEEAAQRQEAQIATLDQALAQLVTARASEGERLAGIIARQLATIETIVENVRQSPARAPAAIAARLNEQVQRLTADTTVTLEPDRLHQEVLILATKADIAEELDRLDAHVAAARDLLSDGGPIGRKLDFLTQEFNREANTLCAKSNDTEITRQGLELKSTIDQMREQVQNIE